jgi:hypothetical protein
MINLINFTNYFLNEKNITNHSVMLTNFTPFFNKTTLVSQRRFYRRNLKSLWNDYHYDISKNTVLKDTLITNALNSFWDKHVSLITNEEHIIVLFRIKTIDGIISTIGKMLTLTKDPSDKNYYFNYLINNLYIKNDEYRKVKLSSIIFSFGIRKGTIERKSYLMEFTDSEFKVDYQNYKKYKLPITMNPFEYGKLVRMDASNKCYFVQITLLTYAEITQLDDNTNEVIIFRNGDPVIEYKDKLINKDQMVRTIGRNEYYYKLDGKLELIAVKKLSSFIKPIYVSDKRSKLNEKFITLDMETRVIDGKHLPYAICWYKNYPKNWGKFYLTNYDQYNSDDMIKDCILDLCKFKFNHHKVYIHNFANFDGIFLLKNLTDLSKDKSNFATEDIKIIMNNGRLISIEFYYKKEHWKESIILSFRDSYQILSSSLKKLGKSFDVTSQKSIFPYTFVNNSNLDLYYVGKVPEFKYFVNITQEEYNKYASEFKFKKWYLKDETLNYCLQDCVALHQVITKFNEFYFNQFKLNINDAPTISSHAFKLYRSKFIPEGLIPMVFGEEHNFIKTAYTGGSTDMFIPSNNKDELVYAYDVNSLYPFIMKHYLMPVGEKTYFEGDIRKYQQDAFGFFYCEITAPSNLEHPIIQLHVKTKGGIRTIAPIGTFKTVIFSEEMDNAIKLGYKFKIIKGYTYQRKIIFDNYVNDLYILRLQYSKDNPMNYIAKLLLNSLYGRFGMKDLFDHLLLLDTEKYIKCTENLESKNYYINDSIKLNDNYLVQLEEKVKQYNLTLDYNVNIAIAAAITGYARIYMSQFKNNPNLKLFYTDTDSIYTNLNPEQMNELFPGIVNSKELGKLKLENISTKAIFLSPKCYCLETIDSKFIYKVKGLINKTQINFDDFNSLLTKDSLITKNQTKWYKSLTEGTISLLEQSYTLQQTDNKRELIYDSTNQLIGTKPYNLIDNEINNDNK